MWLTSSFSTLFCFKAKINCTLCSLLALSKRFQPEGTWMLLENSTKTRALTANTAKASVANIRCVLLIVSDKYKEQIESEQKSFWIRKFDRHFQVIVRNQISSVNPSVVYYYFMQSILIIYCGNKQFIPVEKFSGGRFGVLAQVNLI